MSKPIMTREELDNIGSLITLRGTTQCIGYLMDFGVEHGIHDAEYGRMPLTPAEGEQHNNALDRALLEGLDKNCAVGQGSTAYWNPVTRQVHTFIGTEISRDCTYTKTTVTFKRNGMVFKGRLQKDAECFNYRRVS